MTKVFGDPITADTLRNMPEYNGKQITKSDRAQVAVLFKNSGTKSKDVKDYVEELRKQWGDGVATLGLIYNATGDTINFVRNHDWSGNSKPALYLSEIANGQWGGFLHVTTPGTITGSKSAVVYRCKKETAEYDWMVAWDNPWNRLSYDSKVLTQIHARNYSGSNWETIEAQMTELSDKPNDHYKANGFKSTVAMSECTFPSQGCKLLCAVVSLAHEGL